MAETARAPGSTPRPLDAGTRERIERWFVERGVPQFIDGYSSEQSMDARAAPLIAGWLVIGTLLGWGIRSERPSVWYTATVVATLLFMAAAYLAISRLRGRPMGTRPEKYDLLDIAIFGALPVLPAAVIDASPVAGIVAGLNALLGIGIIYIVIAFGLLEIALWGSGRRRVRSGTSCRSCRGRCRCCSSWSSSC